MADKPTPASEVSELVTMLRRYVLQETWGPIKALLNAPYFLGLGAAFLYAIGAIFGMIGVLRLLQSDTGSWFTGNLNWLPYLITAGAGLLIIAFALLITLKGRKGTVVTEPETK